MTDKLNEEPFVCEITFLNLEPDKDGGLSFLYNASNANCLAPPVFFTLVNPKGDMSKNLTFISTIGVINEVLLRTPATRHMRILLGSREDAPTVMDGCLYYSDEHDEGRQLTVADAFNAVTLLACADDSMTFFRARAQLSFILREDGPQGMSPLDWMKNARALFDQINQCSSPMSFKLYQQCEIPGQFRGQIEGAIPDLCVLMNAICGGAIQRCERGENVKIQDLFDYASSLYTP